MEPVRTSRNWFLAASTAAIVAALGLFGGAGSAAAQFEDPIPPYPFPELPAGLEVVTTLHGPGEVVDPVDCAAPPTPEVTTLLDAAYACVTVTNTTAEPVGPFWLVDGDLQLGHSYVDGLDAGASFHVARGLAWSVDTSGYADLGDLQATLDALVDSGVTSGPRLDAATWAGDIAFDSERTQHTDFASQRAKWDRLALEHYSYTTIPNCYCPPFEFPPVRYRVTVIEGEISSVVSASTGLAVDAWWAMTLNQQLEILADARSDDEPFPAPHQTSVARYNDADFDLLFGVPTRYYIDWNGYIFDEEWGADIGEITPLIPCRGAYVTINACPSPDEAERGDVNCDGTVNIIDALEIVRFNVGLMGDETTCPQAPAVALYADLGDINDDGSVDVIDALVVAQCDAGLVLAVCPPSTRDR